MANQITVSQTLEFSDKHNTTLNDREKRPISLAPRVKTSWTKLDWVGQAKSVIMSNYIVSAHPPTAVDVACTGNIKIPNEDFIHVH